MLSIMKVLSIGMDKDLLKEGSPAFIRHQAYAKKVEEYHCVVFARKEYGKERVTIAENTWAYPTNSSNTLALFFDAFHIGRNILNGKGEWVISVQDPFESAMVGFELSRVTGAPICVQEHGDFFSKSFWRDEFFLNKVRFYVGIWILRRATRVRVVSQRIAKTLMRIGVPKEDITVTPVYTDVESFANAELDQKLQALRPNNGVLILSLGRLVSQKNLSLLVRAFGKALERGVLARLVIVGKGEEESTLRALAKEKAPEGSIVFQEWTQNPAGAIRAADILALSSNYEGWGRVCIEALAVGTPLLMTDVGCAGEVVRDGVQGLVVPIDDEWAFTEGIYKLATDVALREKLSHEGKDTVSKLATFEENVALYIQSLELCLIKKNTSKHT
jgi:glycosyltransferase involved in cell wall biosynthesis